MFEIVKSAASFFLAFDNSFAKFAADIAVTISSIKKICMGAPTYFCLFIEIHNK